MSAATETTTIATGIITARIITAREPSFDMITDGTADGIAMAIVR
jgi:hypothetical protein